MIFVHVVCKVERLQAETYSSESNNSLSIPEIVPVDRSNVFQVWRDCRIENVLEKKVLINK